MTLAPDAPALEVRDLADAVAQLRSRGLRLSTVRRLVLEALFAADGPVSAEYVMRRLRLDLSSVYRNLELLESHGLVRHVHLGHGPGLYALRGHDERAYLYCERCGAVRSVAPEELSAVRDAVREQFGYQAQFTHFPIVGTCAECSTQMAHRTAARHSAQGGQATMDETHEHQHSHAHEHVHGDGIVHQHAHAGHDHEHVEHQHAHSHGDHVHAHPHPHEDGLEDRHEHAHQTGDAN